MSETRQKSDLSRAFSEDGALKTHVGGQALLEGIMMRGRLNWAVAVREPDGGIYTEEHDLAYGRDKSSWLYWPFVRGCRAFVESLTLGYKALSIAAEHAFVEEDEETEAGADSSADSSSTSGGNTADDGGADDCNATADNSSASGGNIAVDGCAVGDGRSTAELFRESDKRPAADAGACAQVASSATAIESAEPSPGGFSYDAFFDSLPEGFFADEARADDAARKPTEFSWMRDFGNPDEMIDALGAQRTLEVVAEPTTTEEPAQATKSKPEKKPLLGDTEMAVSMIVGLVLGIALFVVVPAFVTNLVVGEYDDRTLLWNIVDGVLRIGVFVFYIWLIGRMPDIKRMFGYHGAEHKTIHCFEHNLPLTPENARSFPRLHVRCGTAFLIMVMIIAIFVYTVLPVGALIEAWGVPDGPLKLTLVIVVRIIFMPVIAGIAYEITVKWAGTHPDNPLVKVVLWPGMQMQYLTTREPDDGQIECAIAAMKLVLEREQFEETKQAELSA